MSKDITKLTEKFPFVAHLQIEDGTDYCGVILNTDKVTISFINIQKLTKNELYALITIAQKWWWYSNRSIPLNLFYNKEVEPFMNSVTHLPIKTTTLVTGHTVSLQTVLSKTKTSRKNRTLTILD